MPYSNGVALSYSIEDAKTPPKKSNFSINFPANSDIELLGSGATYPPGSGSNEGFASSTAVLIKPLIKGRIVGCRMTIGVNLEGATLKGAPLTNSDREEGATFTFRSTVGAPTKFRLPTFLEAYGLSNGISVDLSDEDVDAFVQRVIQGDTQGVTTVRYSDSRGNNVSSLIKAVDSFKKYRR